MTDTILGNLCTAIILLDHELRVRFINQAAESLLEISAHRSIGVRLTESIPDFQKFISVFINAIQSRQPYTQRLAELHLHNGHNVTVDFTISPTSEEEWPELIVELHPLDRYLRIDRDAALQKHQEISRQMIRGLAHEVKNPLGGIRGSAQLLEKELDNAELREYTRIIIEETDRLTNLVDRMLGPRNLPVPKLTNIHELLERVLKLLTLENRKLHINRDYDPSIPELLIDPEMIFQAILNVARNALQSMTEIPKPVLSLVTRTERQFTIDATRYRTVLRLDIADNGCGIPDYLKQHLFYPMISGRAEGTGLGLPQAHAAIHQHNGIIEFDSKPGSTVFNIIIPLEQQT